MLLPLCFMTLIECFGFQNFSTFSSEFVSDLYLIIVLSNQMTYFYKIFFPMCNCKSWSGFFGIAAVSSSLLCDLSGCVDKVFLCPFPPAFSQGPLLFFWDWFALIAPKHVHLWDRSCLLPLAVWWLHSRIAFILLYCIIYTDEQCTAGSDVWKGRINKLLDFCFLQSWVTWLTFLVMWRLSNPSNRCTSKMMTHMMLISLSDPSGHDMTFRQHQFVIWSMKV